MMDTIKMPNGIQVGNRYYEVKVVPDLAAVEGRATYGSCNHLLYLIEIDSRRQANVQSEVLLHEVIHIIQDIYDLDGLTETTIQCLAVNLLQLLTYLGVEFKFTN